MRMTPALTGVLLMTAGISVLSIMDGMVKWLMLRELSPLQLIAVRGWIITIAILVTLLLLPRTGGVRALKTNRIHQHIGRSAGGVFAPILFFLSLKFVPLADAVTIFFCTTFIMVAASVVFLKEQVGVHRWSAVGIGFVGVLIAMQPGTSAFQPASLLVLGAGFAYAFLLVSGRWLSRTESSLQLIFYFTFFNTLICTALLILIWPELWRSVSSEETAMIFAISGVALAGYFFITRAFTTAPISVIAPIEYLALFWAVLIGYLVYDEVPSLLIWLGIALILSAGLYIGYRESRTQSGTTTGPAGVQSPVPTLNQYAQPDHRQDDE